MLFTSKFNNYNLAPIVYSEGNLEGYGWARIPENKFYITKYPGSRLHTIETKSSWLKLTTNLLESIQVTHKISR